MKKFKSELKIFKNTKNGVSEYLEFIKNLELMPLRYNRPVKKAHARKMGESVQELGVLRRIIVIRTSCFDGIERLVIGDGQHLVHGILNLKPSEIHGGLSVQIVDIDNCADIIPYVSRLNSTAKNWTLTEFLNSWVKHGIEDYKFLQTVKIETGFGISPLTEAYSGMRASSTVNQFKEGKFKVKKHLGDKTIQLYRNAVAMGLRDCNSAFLAMVRLCTDHPKLNQTQLLYEIGLEPSLKAKSTREYYFITLRAIIHDKLG